MARTKFEEILLKLSGTEFRKFAEFIHSPYFNKSELAIRLFELIEHEQDTLKEKRLTWEQISRHVFPGKRPDAARTMKLTSDFTRLLERFLLINRFEKDTSGKIKYLLEAYREKDLDKLHSAALGAADKLKVKDFDEGLEYFCSKINIGNEVLYKNKEVLKSADIEKMQAAIRKLYLYQLIDAEILKLIQKEFSSKLFPFSDEEIISENEILLTLKFYIYKFLQTEKKIFYVKLRSAFNSCKKELSDNQKVYVYDKLLFIITGYKVSESPEEEEFGIIQEMYKEDILFCEPYYRGYKEFINILNCALKVNEIGWAKNFLKNNIGRVENEFKKNIENLSKALIEFYNKNYDRSLQYINSIKYDNSYFYLQSKMLTLLIYKELGYTEEIIYLKDTVKHYLKKKAKIIDHSDYCKKIISSI